MTFRVYPMRSTHLHNAYIDTDRQTESRMEIRPPKTHNLAVLGAATGRDQ